MMGLELCITEADPLLTGSFGMNNLTFRHE
jgi:hypothetical protein